MIKFLDFTLLFLYCLLIYLLSDQPSLPAPMWFPLQDKVYHALAYFIMAILAWRPAASIFSSTRNRAIGAIVFCSLYAISDEWHQAFVPNRCSDFGDWLADTVGATLAVWVLIRFKMFPKYLLKG